MAFGKKELILTGVAAMAVVCMGGVIGYQAFRSGKSLQQDGYVNWVDDTGEYKKIRRESVIVSMIPALSITVTTLLVHFQMDSCWIRNV